MSPLDREDIARAAERTAAGIRKAAAPESDPMVSSIYRGLAATWDRFAIEIRGGREWPVAVRTSPATPTEGEQ